MRRINRLQLLKNLLYSKTRELVNILLLQFGNLRYICQYGMEDYRGKHVMIAKVVLYNTNCRGQFDVILIAFSQIRFDIRICG